MVWPMIPRKYDHYLVYKFVLGFYTSTMKLYIRGKTTRKPGTALRWNHVLVCRNFIDRSCVKHGLNQEINQLIRSFRVSRRARRPSPIKKLLNSTYALRTYLPTEWCGLGLLDPTSEGQQIIFFFLYSCGAVPTSDDSLYSSRSTVFTTSWSKVL